MQLGRAFSREMFVKGQEVYDEDLSRAGGAEDTNVTQASSDVNEAGAAPSSSEPAPKLVSVVIGCYYSEHTLRDVVEQVMAEFDRLPGYDCEFVLVNDGSTDGTYPLICQLAQEYPCVHGINLMRNFGQHNALMCALNHTSGDYILGMDDDLQTHPSQIPVILQKMEECHSDLVYGVYREDKNGLMKRLSSWLNKTTSHVLLGRPKDIRSSNFWLVTREVRDQLVQYKNYNPNVDALFTRMTTDVSNVTIEHHERAWGQSGYTLGKLAKLWLSYFNYTVVPLRAISKIGVVTAFLGFVMGLVTVIRKLTDPSMTAGWASIICVLLFFFGLTLLTLGIIGEYLGNIVLSLNGTPQYIIREKVNLD